MTTTTPLTESQMYIAADEVKRDVETKLGPVLVAMNDAKAKGMVVNFNIAQDQFGRNIAQVSVIKPLA